jgi:tetratricopeptide (TPR) repeat protein
MTGPMSQAAMHVLADGRACPVTTRGQDGSIVRTALDMAARSYIPRKHLAALAHQLAAGETHKQAAAALGWEAKRVQRCIARLRLEVREETDRHWYTARETALAWLRMRQLCTPAELEQAQVLARKLALDKLGEMLIHAEELRYDGQHAEAERHYLWHLHDDPENVEVLAALADLLVEMERFEAALARYEDALSREPGDAQLRLRRAIVLHRIGRHQDAMVDLELALKYDPDDVAVLVWLSDWRLQADRADARSVAMVKRAMANLQRHYADRRDHRDYSRQIVDVAFFALWHSGHNDEAIAVARTAEAHGWRSQRVAAIQVPHEASRPRLPENLDRQPEPTATTAGKSEVFGRAFRTLFHVLVRARAETRPPHWPEHSVGCFTQYTVAAHTAAEARSMVSALLNPGDPPSARFDLEVVQTHVQLFAPQPWAVAGPPQWTIAPAQTCMASVPELAESVNMPLPELPAHSRPLDSRPLHRRRPPLSRRRTGRSY